MAELGKFDKEKHLLEALDRIARSRSEYRALYVNVSKLKPKNRHPRFVKIIASLFDNVVAVANGAMYILSNGDMVVLGKDITPKIVDEAVDKLRHGLVTDPIWTSHSSSEFTRLYETTEFDVLAENISKLIDAGKVEDVVYSYPVDSEKLVGVKEHLGNINILKMIKHQSVIKFEAANRFSTLFEEFFVAVKDLSKSFDSCLNLTGDKWLFLYLTQILDKKTMYSFMFSDIKNKPETVSLNLNLSTMFLSEFDNFLHYLEQNQQKLIVEVQAMDILNNLPAYFDAKENLHHKGHKILLDSASLELLQALNVERLNPDYIKIFWHELMGEYKLPNLNTEQVIGSFGADKFILAKTMDEKAVKWGIVHGIHAFQGPYIDMLETAIIKSKCPNGKVCSSKECLKRRRLITGEFRNECQHKECLERKLG